MPVEMDHSPDTPLIQMNRFLWHKKFIIQMTNIIQVSNLIKILAE